MPFSNDYFKSALSVDNVIFGFDDDLLKVLLIKRGKEPFNLEWALPGAMVHPSEDLEIAAKRILSDLTGISDVYLEQVKTFGKVDRYPEGRVVTVAYYSLINIIGRRLSIGAANIKGIDWKYVRDIDTLPFDHLEIMQTCLRRLKRRVRTQPVGFELLPKKFTLTQLQKLYEAILDKDLDKRNFRKKILSLKVLEDLNEIEKKVSHRPARLYAFDHKKYEDAKARGINFEI